ncbi:MAG TPA: beta-ketoacyl synthase N-terminal-like domain-containing protein, partial [Blastocatellia bacterium]|nr:beta-ketoacyl synthase N-terminal-like domain-containing protein [Blastocatellia bacterium]
MSKGVAIIGLSGLYPGAADLNEFYRNLCLGVDSVRPLPEERVALSGGILSNDRRSLASIERIDEFDYGFFNISPKEAEYTDPQQRWLLQLACTAIENAGYSLQDLRGSYTAVIVSASNNDYRRLFDSGRVDPTAVTGNLPAALAGRIAYTLDLRGPALVIDTACSSSLVAVTEAYRKVLSGEVDYALAGGINFFFLEDALGAADIGILAPDGKVKAFDDAANGTGFGEGGGIALLKRLEDALADGDHIHAVIRGCAVNQDGGLSNGLTAPSPQAQTEVILRAWREAGVAPESLQLIEAHGTGTKLGDPIEIQGLKAAFRKFTDRKQFCYLGSVKTNIGHLASAAGIAGLTKCALSLRHKKIFPSLHFDRPNALIDFAASPVVVNTELREWETVDERTPRRCGVSSFGLSGTNAHVVLEEAPAPPARTPTTQPPAEELITLSARTQAALAHYLENLRRRLESPDVALADLAYTLNVGRDAYSCRFACVVRSVEELAVRLREASVQGEKGDCRAVVEKQTPVVFLFSGDAAPEQSVCEKLPRDFEVFAERYQQCLARIGGRTVNQAAALFNFQFALYHLWNSCQLQTDKLIGAGAGNKAVAVLTGRLPFDQGIEEALRQNDYLPLDHARLKAVISRISNPYPPLFLEMGAGGALTHAVRNLSTDATKFTVIQSLVDKTCVGLWPAVAELYLRGASFTMKPLYAKQMRRRVELPTYPFEKKRCWVPVTVRQATVASGHAESVGEPVSERPTPVLLDGDGAKTEERLARIWGDALKVYELKRDDDYFELGGDSLIGTQLTNAIAEEFGVTLDFEDVYAYSTIRSLSERIESLCKTVSPKSASQALRLAPVARTEPMPLSSGQRRLWFLDQLEPENPFYNIPLSLRLKGPLEAALLERCLREIVNRHEVLRAVFVAIDGRPGQLIKPSAPVSAPLLDLQRLSPEEREAEALRIAGEDARRPFVLSEGPLFRVTLLRLDESDHLLQLTMHHIVSDGWSIALLVREFVELYRAYKAGLPPSLPELRVQYADYACWQLQWLESEEYAEQFAYWSRKLNGPLPILELPADRARPAVPSYRGARHDFLLPRELTVKLRALGQRENA